MPAFRLVNADDPAKARNSIEVSSVDQLGSADADQSWTRELLAARVTPIIDPLFDDPLVWGNAAGEFSDDYAYATNGAGCRKLVADGTSNNRIYLTHDGTGVPKPIKIPPGKRVSIRVAVRKNAANTDSTTCFLRLRYIDNTGTEQVLSTGTTPNTSDISSSTWTIVAMEATTTAVSGEYFAFFGLNSADAVGNEYWVGAVWFEVDAAIKSGGPIGDTGTPVAWGVPDTLITGQGSFAHVANNVYYSMFRVTYPLTLTAHQFEVTSGPGSDGNVRVGVYAADALWRPTDGAPLYDAGVAVATSFTGLKATTGLEVTLPPRRYLVAVNVDQNMTLRTFLMPTPFVQPSLGASALVNGLTAAQTYGAFPNPGTVWTSIRTGSNPNACPVVFQWRDY